MGLLRKVSRNSLSALATRGALPSSPSVYYASSSFSSARCPHEVTNRAAPAAAFDTSTRSFSSQWWPNHRSRIVHSHARTLLRILHQREWDAALELELAHAGVFLTPHIVDQVVVCIPSAKVALQFFIWAGEQIGYPSPISTAACGITQWYAHKSQLIPFLNILRHLEDPHFCLSPSRVNVLLQGYGWAGMLDRAYSLMCRKQGFSNDILVNCFLFAIMRQYRYEMVCDVYLEMKKWGTSLDVCYNALIQGMSLAGGERWQVADDLYKKMVDLGHIPSAATCNVLVISISKAGKHERAYELLQVMIQMKIMLQNASISAVVECLCHAKRLQEASRLIEQMKQCGHMLDPNVYNSFLGAL